MPNPSADQPASQSPPETPPQTLAQIVDKLRIKALHLRAQALEATDPARRKLYETGAVVREVGRADAVGPGHCPARRAHHCCHQLAIAASGWRRVQNDP